MKATLLLGALFLGCALLTLWLLGLLGGCAVPKAGGQCMHGDAWCADKASALACRDGALQTFSCQGPKGCVVDAGRHVLCDQSEGAVPGTPCFPDYEGKGQCTKDASASLVCFHGSWTATACAQGTTCRNDAGGVGCL